MDNLLLIVSVLVYTWIFYALGANIGYRARGKEKGRLKLKTMNDGFQYRFILDGEIVQAGDEYLDYQGVWHEWNINCSGFGEPYDSNSFARTRRKLEYIEY